MSPSGALKVALPLSVNRTRKSCSSGASTAASDKLAAMRRSPACSSACSLLTNSPLAQTSPCVWRSFRARP